MSSYQSFLSTANVRRCLGLGHAARASADHAVDVKKGIMTANFCPSTPRDCLRDEDKLTNRWDAQASISGVTSLMAGYRNRCNVYIAVQGLTYASAMKIQAGGLRKQQE